MILEVRVVEPNDDRGIVVYTRASDDGRGYTAYVVGYPDSAYGTTEEIAVYAAVRNYVTSLLLARGQRERVKDDDALLSR